MKKALTSIFAPAIAMIALVIASPASADLLVNPGFELQAFTGAEAPGAGTGWTPFNAAFRIQGQPPIGPAGAHGGTVALKVFGNASGAFQQFAASEGQLWNGGSWILNDSLDPMANGQVAAVNIEWINAAGGQISFISNGTFNPQQGGAPLDIWTLKTVTGVAPAGTAFARLVVITGDFLPGGVGGAPRFDDAFFEVIPEPSSIALLSLGAIGLVARRRRS